MNRKQRRRQAKQRADATPTADARLARAFELFSAGRMGDAEGLVRQVLTDDPKQPDALHLLGVIGTETGHAEAALPLLEQAVALAPARPEFRHGLANGLYALRRWDAAAAAFGDALKRAPDFAEARNLLGLTRLELGQTKLAEAEFRALVKLRPDHPGAHYNLGNALLAQNRAAGAAEAYRAALAHAPDFADALTNLGIACRMSGDHGDAEAAFRRVVEMYPESPDALSNLGLSLRAQDRHTDALAAFDAALARNPDFALAHNNRGGTLLCLARMEEAADAYRRAIAQRPDLIAAHNSLLFCLNYLPDIPVAEIARAHRDWAARHADPLAPAAATNANDYDAGHDRDFGRRLRIGYVSPDLRTHSVSFFFEPLLAAHDPAAVETFCYAEVARPDATTARLQGMADHWRDTVGMSDADLAARIRADRIDILVDLAGHTEHNRLLAFARRPAPVQVTWLGYPNTTGMAAMGWRLTDAVADPPGAADRLHVEKLARLEDGFLCYAAPAEAPEVVAPPAEAAGFVTFASFNNLQKLSEPTIRAWGRLLEAVPDARLILKGSIPGGDVAHDRLRDRLAEAGIATGRVEFLARADGLRAHLSLYGRVDIALDTFPYNGTTTTCEALWMGVPVVTLASDRHAGRVGASLLARLGLTDLVAEDADAYVALAAALAADEARRVSLRTDLRDRMAASPLCDSPGFARRIETAYRDMWRARARNL
ncbi:MAG: O-linked N-acetylglucosamine transferase family protein [Alphaproteobacteria bacterium]